MIIRTGYVWTLPLPRRGRGLGAMPQLTGAQYAALTPAQQQAFGNADPNFMSAGTTTPAATGSTVGSPSSALLSTVNNPSYATIPFGLSTTTTYTLDSRMAEWAAGAIAFPSSLMGADPVSEALAFAQSYCAQQAVPDCSNISAIASNYGNQVKAAFASNPAAFQQITSTPSTPGTTSSSQSTSVNSGGASSAAPVVVNPSPASQAVTDGSNIASTGSVSNVANGTSLTTTTTGSTDIIPGIDNGVLFIGAGAAILVLVLAMGGLK